MHEFFFIQSMGGGLIYRLIATKIYISIKLLYLGDISSRFFHIFFWPCALYAEVGDHSVRFYSLDVMLLTKFK